MEPLPSPFILREIIIVPSLSISYSSSFFMTSELAGTSNSALTKASVSPYLIMVLSALLPRIKLIESRITDLPDPVSPDNTLSPLSNVISASEIKAMFLTYNLESMFYMYSLSLSAIS